MQSMQEVLDADWCRLAEMLGRLDTRRSFKVHFFPRFLPVVILRVAYFLGRRGWYRTANVFRMLNMVLFGLEVSTDLYIGPGLILPHTQGTVIGAARVGDNVTIFHQVTLGAAQADYRFDPALRPIVESGVVLSAGAKILGPILLGKDCVIGANAVVLHDVPAGALAVGVPARIIIKNTPRVPNGAEY